MDKRSILIVDDDPLTLRWLHGVLSKAGYEVLTAFSGHEAMDMAITNRPDLMVLDLSLPDMDGVEVYQVLRRNTATANMRVIVLSARDTPEDIAAVLSLGVDDYIVKKRGAEKELLGKCSIILGGARRATWLLPTGRLITFFSAKGGNGTSTLCVNLAYMLAQQVAPKTTLIVDMVLPLGSLAMMTGVQQGGSIAGLTTEKRSLEPAVVHEYISSLDRWGFSVLQGSRSLQESQEINPTRIEPLFDSLMLMFNYVVVDVGRTLSRISLPILSRSDVVVIVLGSDHVTVELTRVALEYLGESGIQSKKLFLILNRALGREGLTKAEIEKVLRQEVRGAVPYAQDNFTLAMNQNIPYAKRFPNDGTNFVLNDLASQIRQFAERSSVKRE